MSRGAWGFLVFISLLLVGLGMTLYLLGTDMARLMLQQERRDAPLVLVRLMAPANLSASEVAAADDAALVPWLMPQLDRFGGDPVLLSRAVPTADGATRWPLLSLVIHDQGGQFVEQLGLSDLRNYTGLPADSWTDFMVLQALGTELPPPMAEPDGVLVAHLARWPDGQSDDAFAERWLADIEDTLASFDGSLIWRARLQMLASSSSPSWDALWLYRFPTAAARDAWLADPERRTLHALQRRMVAADSWLLLEAVSMPAQGSVPDIPTAP